MSNNLLSLVGMAKKAGKLEIGEEPVGNVARAGHAKLIIVAADAADNTARRATHFADAGHVKCLAVPFTKAELGGILGRTSCAMAAFTDAGFAASLVSKLAVQDPQRYADAATQLDAKAQKVLQRQKEQRAHEKNLREGKKRPWAAPVVGRDDSARRSPAAPSPARRSPAAPSPARRSPAAPSPARRSPAAPSPTRPVGKITVKKK